MWWHTILISEMALSSKTVFEFCVVLYSLISEKRPLKFGRGFEDVHALIQMSFSLGTCCLSPSSSVYHMDQAMGASIGFSIVVWFGKKLCV